MLLMEQYFPMDVIKGINDLNKNLNGLTNSIKSSSESSNELQKKLIFWTKIMTGAIVLQAIIIGIQVYSLLN